MNQWIVVYLCTILGAMLPSRHPPPTADQIREVLQRCVDRQNRTPGIVVGVIDANGTNVVAYGKRERGNAEKVDGDSIFEIGSITKVSTAWACASKLSKMPGAVLRRREPMPGYRLGAVLRMHILTFGTPSFSLKKRENWYQARPPRGSWKNGTPSAASKM